MAALSHHLSSDIGKLRESLRNDRSILEQSFLKNGKAAPLLKAHCRLINNYLRHVWQMLDIPKHNALVAVGGFGRGELYPKSDIDLLILVNVKPDEVLQQKLQSLIGMSWDIGLEVGHSVRTLEQCLSESADITVQTNLLETHLLCGSAKLFNKLKSAVHQNLDIHHFFLAKQQEQQKRHARSLEADSNLEPNLKESPGGLRDLQTITWIARAAGLGDHWSELSKVGLINPGEARQIVRHDALLQKLRIRLHYLAKRREDRLIFDFQTALAEQMGIKSSINRRASEHLMQRYYRTKRAVLQFNTILLQNLQNHLFKEEPLQQALNERFRTIGTMLEIRDEKLFEHTPEAIFELFLLLQQHKNLTGLSAITLRALWRAPHFINAAFRRNPKNRSLFMDILRKPSGILHALRRMNQYGILGSYIPAFGRIVGQMQHDLFHVYTVDEHILMVVRNLRRFSVPEYAHEFPICSQLVNEFARPEVLYIAGLFHDIAKGRGGDHSQLGKKDARAFCVQHQISRGDTDLIVWLVEHHLTLSTTAQKKDLSDPEVIANFTSLIKNDRYLVALHLLTVADIRGTSPKVWNAWKGKLLEDLFNQARRQMRNGMIEDRLGEIRQDAITILNLYAISEVSYLLLWAQLEDNYFLDHEAQEIAWHTRLLAHRVNINTPCVKARLSPAGEGLQILFYGPDQRSLFVRICDFFARMHYTIVEAKIHTTRHGFALNSFQVMEVTRSNTSYRDIMTYIEFELTQQLTQPKQHVPTAVSGRISRQLKHFPIRVDVDIKPDHKKDLYVLTLITGDRPGLLARVATRFDKFSIRLHRAKINTMGDRAEDVFWISGAALSHPEQVKKLSEALKQD